MMFRQLIKTGQLLHKLNRPIALVGCRDKLSFHKPQYISRHFSNEFTSSWPEEIRNFLRTENIQAPTAVQEKTLPVILQNKDLVGVARTGSGKTLAFVIPAVMKVLEEHKKDQPSMHADPICLVLAPTRELAAQIDEVFKKFNVLGVRSLTLVGGTSRNHQLRELKFHDHHVYIATPGRLIDLMESRMVDLSKINYVVLDEADRMLDMGFEPQVRQILEALPEDRQTLLWSATWPTEIQDLASEFTKNHELVAIDSEKLKANPNIKQIIEVCEPRKKLKVLLEHLENFKEDTQDPRILIFVNTKRLANELLMYLMRFKHRAIAMHGDRTQHQRDNALRLFKNRSCNIMVATDVAARGLDISDITHIVNFDFPPTIEDYVHRIGRTARHDKKGVSVSFFTENDSRLAKKLIEVLKETSQTIRQELIDMTRKSSLQHDEYFGFRDSQPARRRRNDFYSRPATNFRGGRGSGFDRHVQNFTDIDESIENIREKANIK